MKWWRTIPQCIGGQFGEKEIGDVLQKQFHSFHCIGSFYFWCKEVGLEDLDHFVDLSRSQYVLFSFFSRSKYLLFSLFFLYLTLSDGLQHVLNAEKYTFTSFKRNRQDGEHYTYLREGD